jgi:hypothetical protein
MPVYMPWPQSGRMQYEKIKKKRRNFETCSSHCGVKVYLSEPWEYKARLITVIIGRWSHHDINILCACRTMNVPQGLYRVQDRTTAKGKTDMIVKSNALNPNTKNTGTPPKRKNGRTNTRK